MERERQTKLKVVARFQWEKGNLGGLYLGCIRGLYLLSGYTAISFFFFFFLFGYYGA